MREVNLRNRDLVNMPIAHHGDGAVIVVADIHKGGVFAQVSTPACMPRRPRTGEGICDQPVSW